MLFLKIIKYILWFGLIFSALLAASVLAGAFSAFFNPPPGSTFDLMSTGTLFVLCSLFLVAGLWFSYVKLEHYQLKCPNCQKNNSVRWIMRNVSEKTRWIPPRSNSTNDFGGVGPTTYTGVLVDKCVNCGYEFNTTEFSGDDHYDNGKYSGTEFAPVGYDVWEQRYGIGGKKFSRFKYEA
jgi:hypothetical protein